METQHNAFLNSASHSPWVVRQVALWDQKRTLFKCSDRSILKFKYLWVGYGRESSALVSITFALNLSNLPKTARYSI
ncbi:hypothetical protein B1J94_16690 [Leptospira kirschneri serovar Grippotyphosa]|nr:hypothetical protein B1J94_16690 [Leptospira kirschneri serovar Grippotyphosa]